MGIMCAPDIFQESMSNLMERLEFTRTYLDDLWCLSKDHFDEHLEDVELFKNLQSNGTKSSFGRSEINYLGYVFTRKVVKDQ